MKIFYIGHTRFPTERAHGHQIAHVCSALAALGHDVTLTTPTVWTQIKESPFQYYTIPERFRWKRLPSFDALGSWFVPDPIAFAIAMRSYRKQLQNFFADHKADLLYARSPSVLPELLQTGMPIILELHTIPKKGLKKFVSLCNGCKKVVCLTGAMRDDLASLGVTNDRMIVEGDAVDLDAFSSLPSREHAHASLGIENSESVVVGYAGSLSTMGLSKGVDQIVRAVDALREQGKPITKVIVGGPDESVRDLKKIDAENASHSYLGFVEKEKVLDVYAASDLLIYPAPSSNHPYFTRYTSPMKVFEYMASGTPMVCAAIPPLLDVLDESVTLFYEPGNSEDLAEKIAYAMDHPEEMKQRAAKAHARVQDYSWEKRMQRILAHSNN